jgi:hypothetical protein
MNEWKLQVVLPDGTARNTRFKGMHLDRAEELMEEIRFANDSNGNAIALRVVSERTGRIYSETEW